MILGAILKIRNINSIPRMLKKLQKRYNQDVVYMGHQISKLCESYEIVELKTV